MIKKIMLHNIQSHADTTINFDKGVNAIIGLSDSGKTAILRAFNYVINNRPMGDELLSHWAEEMFASIEFDNGTIVTRGRDKKGNYYRLGNEEFRAFKNEIPPDIEKALNMSEINLQTQMESPFLISASPGEVAQVLNKIVHLDDIDTATSVIRKQKLEVDRELKSQKGIVAELQQTLATFGNLEDMEKDVLVLEQLLGMKDRNNQQSRGLETLKAQLGEKKRELEKYANLTHLEKGVAEALRLVAEKNQKDAKVQELQVIKSQIEDKQTKLENYLRFLRMEKGLEAALSLVDNRRLVEKQIDSLSRVSSSIKSKSRELDEISTKVEALSEAYDAAMPAVCPLCNQRIKK